MPSPFPGMNPWLENPGLWPDVHDSLVIALRDVLVPQLQPRYSVVVRQRTVILTPDPETKPADICPDVTIYEIPRTAEPIHPASYPSSAVASPVTVHVPVTDILYEDYLEVRTVPDGKVVTVIELLSPTNKRPGDKNREKYETKRQRLLDSCTHLVEIDLLRGGKPMTLWMAGDGRRGCYRILVSRARRRPRADLYLFNLPDPIPPFPLPLQPGDNEPVVELGPMLSDLYDRARYDMRIDYTREPVPPLTKEEAAWADQLLHEIGLRE
ncbi:MAG: DUF4058 family protein [Nitrospinae bacterium]|nr:DUF4058 family protein [Nitrospinota bacterium]